jgi:hypothetical protein
LRLLDLSSGVVPEDRPGPIMVPLAETSLAGIEAFGREMQERQREAEGLMRSGFGKARGTVLRLALALEYLRPARPTIGGNHGAAIRERPPIDALWAGERVPDWLGVGGGEAHPITGL